MVTNNPDNEKDQDRGNEKDAAGIKRIKEALPTDLHYQLESYTLEQITRRIEEVVIEKRKELEQTLSADHFRHSSGKLLTLGCVLSSFQSKVTWKEFDLIHQIISRLWTSDLAWIWVRIKSLLSKEEIKFNSAYRPVNKKSY